MITDHASGIQLLYLSKLAINWKNDNGVSFFLHDIIVNFISGPSFMSISLLALELWQFLFINDWPEIQKSEIRLPEFFLISRDWGDLRIPFGRHVSNEKLLNAAKYQDYSFYRSELLREDQQAVRKMLLASSPPTQIRFTKSITYNNNLSTIDKILQLDNFVSVHYRNVQCLTVDLYKIFNGICPDTMKDILPKHNFHLWYQK